MASRAEHWIGRVMFDIAAPDRSALDPLRAGLRDRFDSGLVPLLQAALDRLDNGAILRLGRLEIDLGILPPTPEALFDGVAAGLAARLPRATGPPPRTPAAKGGDAATAEGGAAEAGRLAADAAAIAAYLETGVLPWPEPGRVLAALAAAAMALDAAGVARLAERLRGVLARRRGAERLVRQFPALLVRRLVAALLPRAPPVDWSDAAPGSDESWSPDAPVPERRVARLAQIVRRAARRESGPVPDAPSARTAQQDVAGPGEPAVEGDVAAPAVAGDADDAAVAAERAEAAAAQQPSEADQAARADEKSVLPVAAAGAVLLHPFLATYFERVGLLAAPGTFRDPRARARAVLLTHHLATGREEAPEPDTILAKLLCGLPFADPVPRRIRLTAAEREQSVALLDSVIRQWSKLGKTSPAGLRDGFLSRAGRLERRDDDSWRLVVERRGIDVLLDALPWGLSIVKTPFMPALLRVDWR